jgi:hypothetical protein
VLLACSKFHELNHEAFVSNYCACLSAAGDEAEFMDSSFASVKILQFNSSQLVPNIVRMALSDVCQKAKTIVMLVVCLPWPLEHKSHPHMGIGRPPVEEPYGSSGVHTEDDYVVYIIICIVLECQTLKTEHMYSGKKNRGQSDWHCNRQNLQRNTENDNSKLAAIIMQPFITIVSVLCSVYWYVEAA